MQKIGMSVDFSEALSETDYEIIEEKISHYLQKKGFDSDYQPTENRRLCESILDKLEYM